MRKSVMKSTELRIGNLVYPFKDTPKKVLGVGANILVAFTDSQFLDCEIHQIEPIPLTEEWLVKFGFERVIYDSDETGYGTEYELKANNDVFINYSDDFSCAIYDSKSAMKDSVGVLPTWNQCKYVHGLQNLYFALTGEELTINER
jgi:hypothetical protein